MKSVLPLLWADRHSPELHCAAVNSPQQPVTELYAIHKMPRDFCQALLLRIDQNGSGEAVYLLGLRKLADCSRDWGEILYEKIVPRLHYKGVNQPRPEPF